MTELDPGRPIVLDASVGVAIIRSEAPGAEAANVVARHRSAGGRLIAPDLFWLELTNVLPRRYQASPEQVVAELMAIDGLEIESIRIDRPLLLFALDLQHRHGLSAYDAVYLALAEAENARLLTLDARLATAAGPRAIGLPAFGPHHAAEASAAYRAEPVDWARFGPYLARLRAQA
jgi:predicted nucleic acid-binding protein